MIREGTTAESHGTGTDGKVAASDAARSWRYICPHCGATSLRMRVRRSHDPTGPVDKRPRCEGCERRVATVYDKRDGVEVGIRAAR